MGEHYKRHGRIIKELPVKLRKEFDRRLMVNKMTYDELRLWLESEGYDFALSTIGAYGRQFFGMYQKLMRYEQHCLAVMTAAGKESASVMEEAIGKLFLAELYDMLLEKKFDIRKDFKLLAAFASLQNSNLNREKMKSDFDKKSKEAAKDVGKILKKKGLSEETLQTIKNKILGVTD